MPSTNVMQSVEVPTTIQQKLDQLEAALLDCHRIMDRINGQASDQAPRAERGAVGLLNDCDSEARRLIARLEELSTIIGTI